MELYFVLKFCREITDDDSPVDELRVTLRFFASVLLRRIYKVRNTVMGSILYLINGFEA